MAYTQTTKTGYGKRVGNSFRGIGLGLLLFVVATILLWWNEGRAVHTAQDIKEVGKTAVHVDDIQTVAPEGQLIHANGIATTTDTVEDTFFGVKVNALSLIRQVEYYQWVEHSKTETKEKIGGSMEETTTYTYECEWVRKPVDSKNFHDPAYQGRNTAILVNNFEEETFYASVVDFGAYKMPQSFIPEVSSCSERNNTVLNISAEKLAELNELVFKSQSLSNQVFNNVANAMTSSNGSDWVHVMGNQVYLGRSAGNPSVGDVRVTFLNSQPSAQISLIAVVEGRSFVDYKTKNESHERYITSGKHTLEEMMQSAEHSNKVWTWVLRALGFILVSLALKMILGFIETLAKVLPFVSKIIGWGIGLICYVIGFAYSLIVIAIAWIYYRPILGICLLAVAAGVGGGFIYLAISRKRQANAAPTTEDPEFRTEE